MLEGDTEGKEKCGDQADNAGKLVAGVKAEELKDEIMEEKVSCLIQKELLPVLLRKNGASEADVATFAKALEEGIDVQATTTTSVITP